jgi:hypothetical protein
MSKSKGTLKKKDFYCKDTETKLISLFNVIPLDFNAPVPPFHKLLNSVRKKKVFFGYVFNQFFTAPVFIANRHRRRGLGVSLLTRE